MSLDERGLVLAQRIDDAFMAQALRGGKPAPDIDVIANVALAHDVLDYAGDDPARIAALEDESATDLLPFLLELPFALASLGRVDEALRLCERAGVFDPTFLPLKLNLLRTAGRTAEAYVEAESLAARLPGHAALHLEAGQCASADGHHGRAGVLLNRALKLARAEDDSDVTIAALEQLVKWLEDDGRPDEARELDDIRERMIGELEDAAAREFGGTGVEDDEDLLDIDFEEDAPRPGRADEATGRNDPCPCGSGRKFKKCCGSGLGRRPEAEEKLLGELFRRMLEFAGREEHVAQRDAAPAAAYGAALAGRGTDTALDDMDEDWELPVFLEWMLFDYRLQDGTTFASRFGARRRGSLVPLERQLVDRACGTRLAFWRVESVRAGSGATVVDLLEGGSSELVCTELGEYGRPGDVFAARTIVLDDAVVLTGGIVPFEPEDVDRVVARFTALRAEMAAGGPAPSWADVLKSHGAEFLRLKRE